MPDPSTSRLGLYKSKSDGSELVSYSQDIGQNLDKIDLAVGALACTSSTRPSTPWNGQLIRETNTGRVYVWSGSAWLEVVTAGTTPNFTSGLIATGPTTGTGMFSTFASGDSVGRFGIQAGGTLSWGDGTSARDTNLYRSAANTLATDDSFSVGGDLSVTGVGQVLTVVKSADTSRANNATVTADPHLQLTVAANATYLVEMFIAYQALSTVDISVTPSAPASSTGLLSPWAPDTSIADGVTAGTVRYIEDPTPTANRMWGGAGSTNRMSSRPVGTLITSSTAGTYSLGWAQGTSDPTATIVFAGSWMKLRRVA